jgi:hypothetical protein
MLDIERVVVVKVKYGILSILRTNFFERRIILGIF